MGKAVAGRKRGPVHQERFKEGMRRIKRAIVLGAGGRRKVIKPMVIPSVTYGSAAQMLPKRSINSLRAEMARTFGPIEGKLVIARLLIEEVDPLADIVEKAVMMRVCAAWDGLIGQVGLKNAWRVACVERMSVACKRKGRQGGASALWDALEKLGWGAPAHDMTAC